MVQLAKRRARGFCNVNNFIKEFFTLFVNYVEDDRRHSRRENNILEPPGDVARYGRGCELLGVALGPALQKVELARLVGAL